MSRVRCYWNLARRCWSIQDAKTRRVIGHAKRILLRDVTFTVSDAGRRRVLAEGVKNVHAFACGSLEAADFEALPTGSAAEFFDWSHASRANVAYAKAAARLGRFVSYNPRRDETFVEVEGETRTPIKAAEMALLDRMPGNVLNRKAALLAFDPCQMTAEESAKATQ